MKRFLVKVQNEDKETVLETDSVNAVLDTVTEAVRGGHPGIRIKIKTR